MFSYVISCPIHMISHTFGWGLAVNVLFHLLTCSIICSKSLLYMFLHLANIFRATLCLVFFTWLHVTSFVLRFTCFLDMIVHRASILPACYPLHVFCTCMYILLTYFMLCCTCFFYWLYITLTSFMLRCTCLLMYMILHHAQKSCRDMELCFSMSMAIQSSPYLVATGAQSSERTWSMKRCSYEWEG